MANTKRRDTARRWTFVAIILIALISVIGGTYARYSSIGVVDAKIDIANWYVNISDENGNPINTTNLVTFKVNSNPNVAEGKIAPTSSASAKIIVNMTGTEVAALLAATIDQSAISTVFGSAANRVSLTLTVDGITYNSGSAAEFSLNNVSGEHEVVLTLTWVEDNTDSINAEDTSVGLNAAEITLPVTITVTQKV